MNKYLCRFDDNGYCKDIRVINGLPAEKKEEMVTNGYIEIDEKEWAYYVGAKGMGTAGTGYIRVNGKPVSAPPHVPSKEEKLATLEAEYEQESAELEKYYNKANIKNDTDLMDELREEMANLEAEYEAKRKEIEEAE